MILVLKKICMDQFRGGLLFLTEDFQKNGLPWTKKKQKQTQKQKNEKNNHKKEAEKSCKSIIAGLSGILYCLPASVIPPGNITHRYEQLVWCLQGILSVFADYVYIEIDHYVHGLDRIFATSNTLYMFYRALFGTNSLENPVVLSFVFGVVPITSFVLANQSKGQRNLSSWIVYHCLWHVSGSISVTFVVYLLYNCGSPITPNSTTIRYHQQQQHHHDYDDYDFDFDCNSSTCSSGSGDYVLNLFCSVPS